MYVRTYVLNTEPSVGNSGPHVFTWRNFPPPSPPLTPPSLPPLTHSPSYNDGLKLMHIFKMSFEKLKSNKEQL